MHLLRPRRPARLLSLPPEVKQPPAMPEVNQPPPAAPGAMDFLQPKRPVRLLSQPPAAPEAKPPAPAPEPKQPLQLLLEQKMQQTLTNPSDMWEIFSKCDADRSGTIDKEEFKRAMRSMGYPNDEATKKEAEEIFSEMDTDKNGLIDFDEFYYAMKENISTKELSKDIFNRIIKTSKEKISFEDLKEIIKECGLSLSDEDIHDMITYAPKHERGEAKESDGIDQDEFYELLKEIGLLKSIKLSL